MSNVGVGGEVQEDINNPEQFAELTKEEQEALMQWIREQLLPHKEIAKGDSYGLKHVFERSTDIYVTNGAFKGAMLKAGFAPVSEKEMNWRFRFVWRAAPWPINFR